LIDKKWVEKHFRVKVGVREMDLIKSLNHIIQQYNANWKRIEIICRKLEKCKDAIEKKKLTKRHKYLLFIEKMLDRKEIITRKKLGIYLYDPCANKHCIGGKEITCDYPEMKNRILWCRKYNIPAKKFSAILN